jgi:hypothetical protein
MEYDFQLFVLFVLVESMYFSELQCMAELQFILSNYNNNKQQTNTAGTIGVSDESKSLPPCIATSNGFI